MIGTSYGTVGVKRMHVGTELKFVIFPKICITSGKYIWLKYAYKETNMYIGPGDPVFEYCWYDKNEYLIAKLKGEV